MSALIGRERDLLRIERIFEEGTRLVTVLGPPGMGKTSLAREHASRAPAAVRFCELAEVTAAADLEHAVCAACGVDDTASLAEARVELLVLDNFEQLLPEGARVVEAFCRLAPEMRVLVTSRERLAVSGEHVIELEPLADADAMELFLTRARAVSGLSRDGAHDTSLLEELVRRLDGIPLAIELAAARTRLFSPRELLRRLSDRFALLVDRGRGSLARHATLESAIAWTWNLLAADEQRALAECSVFAGSFAAVDLESIASSPSAVELLAQLRDKSLVFATTTPDRFALYVSIREYAGRKLDEAGEAVAVEVRWRHARHYASRAREFGLSRTLQGAEPDSALRGALTADRDNLVAALAFARRDAQSETFVDLAIGVSLLQAVPAEVCRRGLDEALGAVGTEDGFLRARLLLARHAVLTAEGRFDEAEADTQALLAMPNLANGIRAYACSMRGIRLRTQARWHDAWASHLEAAALLESVDVPRIRAMNLACMGRLQCDFGDVELGRSYNARAHALAAQVGDGWLEALVLGNLAQLEQELGDFDRAEDHLRDALRLLGEAAEPQYVAVYSIIRGDLCFERGELERARESYAAGVGFLNAWRAMHRMSVALYASWGALEATCGDVTLAAAHFSRARHAAAQSGTRAAHLTVDIHEGALHLCRARASGDAERLGKEIARWRARVAELDDVDGGDDRLVVATSIDVRFAVRMLRRALGPSGERRLTVGDGWFSLDGAPRVSLVRRTSLRNILTALVDVQGTVLSADALLERGWPSERLLHEAGRTRLRVAITTLRKFGLRDVIVTKDDGYMLDTALRVERLPVH
jgi:predicted ATPase